MSELNKTQLSLVTTTTLPARVTDTLIAAVIEQKQYVARLRDLAFVDDSPAEGELTYPYEVFDAQTDAADVSEGSSPSYDDAGVTESTGTIVKIMKGFRMSWEADNLKKINLRVGSIKTAVDKVMDREDSKFCTTMIAGAGNTYAGTDWSSATADPIYDIKHSKRLNRDDGYMSDYILLNPTNNEELDSVIASNAWYGITEQTIRSGDDVPILSLKRKEALGQTLGTASLATKGAGGSAYIAEAKALSAHIFDDNDAQVTKCQVYERVYSAAMVRTASICTLTGL